MKLYNFNQDKSGRTKITAISRKYALLPPEYRGWYALILAANMLPENPDSHQLLKAKKYVERRLFPRSEHSGLKSGDGWKF